MNDLQIFNSKEFGDVRAVIVNDLPWFVGKDVCEAFGDTNYRRSLLNIDDSDRGVSQIDTPGGKQNMVIINESGLYSLLFQMQPQKAKGVSQNDALVNQRIEKLHRFKHWVTSEVLPSIRKAGSYSMPKTTGGQIQLLAQGYTELEQKVNDIKDDVSELKENAPLYSCDIDEIQQHVKRRVVNILGGKQSEAYRDNSIRHKTFSDIWTQLKREYGCVSTYKSIKRKYIDDVHEFIDCYVVPKYLDELIQDANAQQSFV